MKKNIVKIALSVLALIPISVKAQITLTDDLLEKQVNKLYETLKNGTTTENTSIKGEIKLDKTRYFTDISRLFLISNSMYFWSYSKNI